MAHFFVSPEQVRDDRIVFEGGDVNHMKNVLRMKIGEKLTVSDKTGLVYECEIASFSEGMAEARILSRENGKSELNARIVLYQGLPKSDKMELIVQKAVELGAAEVVPVLMKRCIVKPDPKKEENRRKRLNAIAESAAKQSGRDVIPEVSAVKTYKEAVKEASENCDVVLLPYEKAEGMKETKAIIEGIQQGMKIGIFIGPEGGFEEKEVEEALEGGAKTITLGNRILRTETAGLTILSILMFHLSE